MDKPTVIEDLDEIDELVKLDMKQRAKEFVANAMQYSRDEHEHTKGRGKRLQEFRIQMARKTLKSMRDTTLDA